MGLRPSASASGELNVGAESLGKCKIALARQAGSKVGHAQGTVHLGVTTAHHVERQPLGRLLEHLQLQSAVLAPEVERSGKGFQALLPQPAREFRTTLPGEVGDDLAEDSTAFSCPSSAANARTTGPTIRASISRCCSRVSLVVSPLIGRSIPLCEPWSFRGRDS